MLNNLFNKPARSGDVLLIFVSFNNGRAFWNTLIDHTERISHTDLINCLITESLVSGIFIMVIVTIFGFLLHYLVNCLATYFVPETCHSEDKKWKWKKVATSFVHSSITGVCSLKCIYQVSYQYNTLWIVWIFFFKQMYLTLGSKTKKYKFRNRRNLFKSWKKGDYDKDTIAIR